MGHWADARSIGVTIWLVLGLVAAPVRLAPAAEGPPRLPAVPDGLPAIAIHVVNDSDLGLSVTVTNARPGGSGALDDCLRWGLVDHARAVFLTDDAVAERRIVSSWGTRTAP